ncbi:hypothetical protein TcCL_ESM10448 [Trypanosoma cruzi]|nr:hypothetical protein TcCL_ESM10448 [Trypanosoma cruzi]
MGNAEKNLRRSMNGVKHLVEYIIPHTTTNAIAGLTQLPASVGLARTNPPHIICQVEVTQTMCLDVCVCLVCAHISLAPLFVYVRLRKSNKHTSNAIRPYDAPNIGNQHKKSCVHRKYHQFQTQKRSGHSTCIWRKEPIEMDVFYWTSNAECRPRRRRRSRLAAQRRPHRNSMECYHGGSSRGKQKQRTGTSSSNSVITGSRRCVLPAVRLAASIPAAERSFLRSVRASWPDPLLLWRRMLLESSRVYILRWCAAAGLNALRNGDGCPWQSLFSRCRWNRPASHALSSPSHETTGSSLPLLADIVHTCAWSRQITFPSS